MYSVGDRFESADVFQLLLAFKRMRSRMQQGMAELGLAPGQEMLLGELWRHDGLSQRELVDRLGVEQSTVAKTVRRLEAGGFVRREPDARDGRVSRVLLADRGRDVRDAVERLWRKVDEEFGAGLDRGERERLVALLAKSFGR
ncbi:DNA-binding MarR family transcriptional regulator [Saccharothrix ecbatanensis]|jgi:DNA-binding MarR family transcriptional regulator|uniref:DNA-binding MarR family transcriptional regulator n=1 Tax=Saccharothrix ecbatanensis TaxID=1105145 RepID=A0A7W9M634_9PSEU|nr:MarR family transcriptional regulator [Saccharothrix ecbatanensis]MBB5808811.1 DNA-binding MarR family transcriptional regulator [Saccharothrix ecbatanensis]